MNTSLKWLRDHVDFSDFSIEKLDELLTFAGIEVEGIRNIPDKLVVAKVLESVPHPDADKLSVCQVDDGSGTNRQIVCGAKNYQVGDLVPLALPGCQLEGEGGKPFEIKEGKLRGVPSLGMMCAASEIGLAKESDGLMILPEGLTPGTPMAELYPAVFELEITPNRPDCLSHLGVARELAALVGKPLLGVYDHTDSATPTSVADESIVSLQTEMCPFYTLRRIKGVKVAPSPAWLQEKLDSIGLRPINNVVDVTNYVLHEMGHPLHAFDAAKVTGPLRVREAAEGETFKALDGETYTLEPGDGVIADDQGILALAGVMGGEDSGVTESTTDILLESAYFCPTAVRRTSRRLNLHSDSSYRFERGADAYQAAGASDLAVKHILDLASGSAEETLHVAGELPAAPAAVALDNDYVRQVIGAPISDERISSILTSLGMKDSQKGWVLPTFRVDLPRAIDLVEEVARVIGLDEIPAETKARFAPASKSDASYDFCMQLGRQLAAIGFHENRTLKLISEAQLADNIAVNHRGMSPIRLKNPLNDEQDYLRPGILPGLLASAERNQRFGNRDLRFYEMGRVFTATPKGGEVENEHFALLMTGASRPRNWAAKEPSSLDIHDLLGVLDAICPGVALVPIESDAMIGACSIELGTGKKAAKLGMAGILPPARARELGLDGVVLVAEMNLKKLQTSIGQTRRFTPLPKFPASSRDTAFLVDSGLPVGRVSEFFAAQQEQLLESVELFDVFHDPSGEKLPADKKSLAYSLTYRHPDRTLESAEVETAHEKLLTALKQSLNVDFR